MNQCYSELNFDIFPFTHPVKFLLDYEWPENRMDKLYSTDYINPELKDFFQDT
jgi:hypothetical protein